ncbi:MAG: acetyl-CoA acetyltransferase [Acidobacteriota bacterium]|nr:acetyl-CoA acetyltransferase [Acidobacteriota bacterium]MXZ37293.1 acetyl-CoA acetyltransferase [Holophagales bacterium]MDE2923118.1 acetyl-CoA acetyltransferase [Acidobacteriota bacterium]MDE3265979.1 acetyl-CoA acetyltransferase [Acidobacteriota bacterium]MYF06147.1 acetyl-CoA acetyltransferase [Holophagales bacterium]
MASKGICDRVAIVGMGCTKFGEHWNRSASDLLVDAVQEAYGSAGIEPDNVDAYWLGTTGSGISGLTLSEPLKIQYKPVTRLENMCATGSEAIRNAAYAVASGAYDLVMAVGVEKLKDSGFSGLTGSAPPGDGTESGMTAPANFSLLAPAYAEKYGVDLETMRDVLTQIAYKNHYNGARNEKAQFQREVPIEKINASPKVAGMLGIMDCSGVSDGSAAAVICRAEDAHKYNDNPIFIKALSFVAGPSEGAKRQDYDFTTFPEVVESARDAYVQAGIEDPREQISMAEVHDCFTPTELVLMEDLGFSPRGQAWKDTMDGRFDLDGEQPVNPDGGLKSFGHPIGASGLRMMYEMWLQLRGEAGERQIADPKLGLTHNLGGAPGRCVSFVSVVGL